MAKFAVGHAALEAMDTTKNYHQEEADVRTDYEDIEAQKKKGCCSRCLSNKCTQRLLRFLFSNIGLCILVLGYTVAGAFLFIAVELPSEKDRRNETRIKALEIEDDRAALVTKVIESGLEQAGANRSDIVDLFKLWLDDYHAKVAEAISKHDYDGHYYTEEEEKYDWDIASTVLFTASILTTIGYGHITPVTEMGRLVTLLYSVIALPLVSIFIINVGASIADLVRAVWARGLCYPCWKKRLVSHNEWPPKDHKAAKKAAKEAREAEEAKNAAAGRAKSATSGGDILLHDAESMDARSNATDPEGGPIADIVEEEEVYSEEQPVPLSLMLFILCFYIMLGTVAFYLWTAPGHEWSLINSLYFSWVTLLTIGFGDYVPGLSDINALSGQFRIVFASAYIIVGLAVMAMGLDLFSSVAEDKARRAREKLERRKENRDEEKKQLLDKQNMEDTDNNTLNDRRSMAMSAADHGPLTPPPPAYAR